MPIALRAARDGTPDSPLFQLIDGLQAPTLAREKTDVFRERVVYSARMKERLAEARGRGLEALRAIEVDNEPIADCEAGIVIDLFLSYRAVKGWNNMIALVEKMSRPLARSVLVREQLALALNRAGNADKAERVLLDLLAEGGASSETYGILGRVYKDRWEAASKSGEAPAARGYLDCAIDAYLKGFEADWRDAYPGVNAVTLMEVREPPDPRRERLIPVVTYAVERRMTVARPDYWDHATLLELAVLAKDRSRADAALASAMAEAAIWPDRIDRAATGTSRWHFINIPLGEPFSIDGHCANHDCVVDQIENMRHRLQKNQTGFSLLAPPSPPRGMTSQELAFLIHFVGDIHQPLHAITNGDRGGGCVPLNIFQANALTPAMLARSLPRVQPDFTAARYGRLTGIRGAGAGGCTGARAVDTAAKMSRRPQPKTGFGTAVPGIPPHCWSDVRGTAVARRSSSVSGTWPASHGAADQRSATAPETCGVAIDVPENRE